jgi:predicted Zn-dependent protease
MNTNNLIVSGYKITESNKVINQLYGITPEIQEKLAEMSVKVQKKKNSAIKELNDLIKKYPFVPQFKNYLSTLYDMQGNHFYGHRSQSPTCKLASRVFVWQTQCGKYCHCQ